MRTSATARFVRLSSRKAGLVLSQIRGKPVGEALAILEYTPRTAARLIAKVLRSAIANAEHNHQVRNLDDLRVVEAVANGGPMMKRVQPRAMGRAFFIRHRTSHLTVSVSDEMNGARGTVSRAERAAARRARATREPATSRRGGRGKGGERATAKSGASGTPASARGKRKGEPKENA